MYTERGTWLSHISWFKHSTIFCQCSDPKHSPRREQSQPSREPILWQGAKAWRCSSDSSTGKCPKRTLNSRQWGPRDRTCLVWGAGGRRQIQSGKASWGEEVACEPGFGLGNMKKETKGILNRTKMQGRLCSHHRWKPKTKQVERRLPLLDDLLVKPVHSLPGGIQRSLPCLAWGLEDRAP